MSANDISLRLDQLNALFSQRGLTLGLAESCTGGLLSSWICSRAGVSAWYQGAVVSYSGAVKQSVLQVPRTLIDAHGEVSQPVALAMARGARAALGCDWSVSITGIAGPGGGSPQKPVGYVCFAVSGPGVHVTVEQRFSGDRSTIQTAAALYACDLLLNRLTEK